MEDHYGILGISSTASQEEIKRAYRNLIKVWHPDICTRPNAHEQSIKIITAHKILSDPNTRRDYDYLRKQHQNARKHQTGTGDPARDGRFAQAQQKARQQAERSASKSLEDLLREAGRYIWQGEYSVRSQNYSFGSRLITGLKGFFLMVLIIVTFTGVAAPATIPLGIVVWQSLLRNGEFIGIGKLLSSTLMVTVFMLLFIIFIFQYALPH